MMIRTLSEAMLSEHAVQVVKDALKDPDAYVRGQAVAASDDIETFIG